MKQRHWQKPLVKAVAMVLLVLSVGFCVAAVWTSGRTSSSLFGTGMIAAFGAGIVALIANGMDW